MSKKLILVAHDNFEKSKNNKALIISINSLSDVTVHHILPNFVTEMEQALLLNYDIIVFQFPLQWFSTPIVLKSWFDKVLSYNYAYGDSYKLENKKFMISITTGGQEAAYEKNGSNGFTLDELLTPIEATIKYIKGINLQRYVLHNVYQLSDEDLKNKTDEYLKIISSL
jgi:putative NADPH-quinone reductase